VSHSRILAQPGLTKLRCSASGRIDSITRTPRMYALAAVLGTPLVAFKERNFLAARGNFSWTTLSTVSWAANIRVPANKPLSFVIGSNEMPNHCSRRGFKS